VSRAAALNNPAIKFTKFGFRYRTQKNPTLYDINLEIQSGEKILIAGPSGSGKSTLGSCLNGLIPFDYPGEVTGELLIGGRKPESIFKLSETVGTVLQDTDAQFVGLTSGEDIAFALENRNVAQESMKQRVIEAAKMVGAENYLTRSPFNLSGGQKQRVSMAGVMVGNAHVLLFDEPLAAIDPLTGRTAVALIDDISKQTGATIIIIEHRFEDVLYRHIDRVILMNDGHIIAVMPPDEMVCSGLLEECGVREPLYFTALKYAGVKITPDKYPGRLDTLILEESDKARVREYASTPGLLQTPLDGTPLLEVKNLSFAYEKGQAVLSDVNIKLAQGEMTAIIGANGAGKSSFAKILVGFEKESGGSIIYNGKDFTDKTIPERAEKIGYVMQSPNQMLCKPMVYDEVALGLRARGVSESDTRKRVEKTLEICGLSRFLSWPVSALSYGQKKRVTIADALILEPEILIMDEPTAGQDWRSYTRILDFLKELNTERGITVLMITHDMHLCLEYARRALVFAGGRLLCDAAPADALSDPNITMHANLKETSLFDLAKLAGCTGKTTLTRVFIREERRNHDSIRVH
jgi:energy-coupling factor transport system ATP-binding protein